MGNLQKQLAVSGRVDVSSVDWDSIFRDAFWISNSGMSKMPVDTWLWDKVARCNAGRPLKFEFQINNK